jgi:hypothetical protein
VPKDGIDKREEAAFAASGRGWSFPSIVAFDMRETSYSGFPYGAKYCFQFQVFAPPISALTLDVLLASIIL